MPPSRDVLTFPAPSPRPEPRTALEVSVVVPVFDEEPCLGPLWDALRPVLETLGRRWEVLFVDDGSRDASAERLAAIACNEPAVRVLQLDRHAGQTAALDAGFRAARGRFVVTLDADLQNPPSEIPRLLGFAEDVDLVYGRRRIRHDPWTKRVASRIGNAVRNAITGHHVHDTGCSLKVFRRRALERVPLFQGMHRFLPTLFAAHGLRVLEVEVGHGPRIAGRSKHGFVRRATRGLLDCLAVRWMVGRSLTYRSREEGRAPSDE